MTDIVSGLDITVFPIIGLVCFLGAFAMIAAKAMTTSKSEMNAHGRLPIDDDNA